MARFNMKAAVIAIAVASAGVSSVAVGSLSNTMNDMFMTTSTKPQPYNSSTRNGFYGGSYSIRTPVRNYTLMSFSAPRISAGCSGISLSAGSFSMMNSDQFKQMIRQIGSSAGMYFFKMAIETISPSIMRNLNGLEKFMQDMTLNNVNTCKVGENLAKAALGKPNDIDTTMEGIAKDAGKVVGVAKGFWSDPVAAWNGSFNETADAVGGMENLQVGNSVWRLLVMANVHNAFGVGSTTHSPELMMQYSLNLVGTIVTPKEETGRASVYKNMLRIEDILDGSNENSPKDYYACTEIVDEPDGMDCLSMELKRFEFMGTRRYVNNILFGNPDKEVIEPGSLLYNLGQGAPLTNEQLSFLQALPPDFVNLYIKVQKSYAGVSFLVTAYREYLAMAFAEKIAGSLLRNIKLATDGNMGNRKVRFELNEDQTLAFRNREIELSKLSSDMNKARLSASMSYGQALSLASANPKVFYQPIGRN